jgi:DNA-binding NarL/FixJ family response regulator
MTPAELDVLLVEDNPGDARLIEEMLSEVEDLLHRIDLDGSTPEGLALHHEETRTAGLDRLADTEVDVVLLDLGLPESTGLDTLVTVLEEVDYTPVVVLTGLDDRDLGITAIQQGAQDYLVKDDVTGELLVHSIQYAIERTRRECEEGRHREQLEALNHLNEVAHDITHEVISTSTREDLERAVCQRLVEPDAYRFAWIGEVEMATEELSPSTTAGHDGEYLEEVTIPVGEGTGGARPDGDRTAGDRTGADGGVVEGPGAKAVRNRVVQVVDDVRTDAAFEPWRAAADEHGFRSAVAVPIANEDLVYGVLGIYADVPGAFSGPEAEVLSRLGDVIGHAITAIERRDALAGDTVLEIEFRGSGAFDELVALAADTGGTLAFDHLVRTDEGVLAYGRADGVPREALSSSGDRSPAVEDVRLLSSGEESYEFELLTGAVCDLAAAVATHGGQLAAATVDEDGFRFVVEFPPGRDRRQLVDLVETHHEGAVPLAQRTVTRRDHDEPEFPAVFRNRLTDKQRAALEAAYFAGYFDWPRTTTGQEVADRLGVTPPTFSQHLRAAEQAFFDAVFETRTGEDERPADSWTSFESDA